MSNYDRSRRNVLRGLLAAGCVVCLPRLSWAQNNKLSKTQAQYRDQPKDDQKCGNCIHFIAPDACHLVEGKISPEGWCMLWAKKTD
jgi:hypothetical protein